MDKLDELDKSCTLATCLGLDSRSSTFDSLYPIIESTKKLINRSLEAFFDVNKNSSAIMESCQNLVKEMEKLSLYEEMRLKYFGG